MVLSCVKVAAEQEGRSAITVMALDARNGDVPTVLPLDEYNVIIIGIQNGTETQIISPVFLYITHKNKVYGNHHID